MEKADQVVASLFPRMSTLQDKEGTCPTSAYPSAESKWILLRPTLTAQPAMGPID